MNTVLFTQFAKTIFVIGAIAPEAESDRRGFDRGVRLALKRLAEIKEK